MMLGRAKVVRVKVIVIARIRGINWIISGSIFDILFGVFGVIFEIERWLF
jgi:hypothetical protein